MGWGADSRRAQGALRLPRGDQHDHAQLHRLRAGRLLGRSVFEHATVRTAEIGAGAVLPRFDLGGPRCAARRRTCRCSWRSPPPPRSGSSCSARARGYELRAVGLNPGAAEFGGIPIGRTQTAGPGALGRARRARRHRLRPRLQALLRAGLLGRRGLPRHRGGAARAQPSRSASSLAALFFGALAYGGLVINERVPKELVEILQALVILFAISAQQVLERVAQRIR